jgi:hypothetical protein
MLLALYVTSDPAVWRCAAAAGLLFEMGWEKIATLMFLAWQAQWQGYAAELRANLSLPALVIPIVSQTVMQVSRMRFRLRWVLCVTDIITTTMKVKSDATALFHRVSLASVMYLERNCGATFIRLVTRSCVPTHAAGKPRHCR